jgi:hypothetical protein
MPCEVTTIGESTVILCSRNSSRRSCATPGCGSRAPFLCDYPIGTDGKRTCDRPMCGAHAFAVFGEKDKHYCPPHRRIVEAKP